jgi:hypothetical protein
MSPETYWLVVPLDAIVVSAFHWLARLIVRPHGECWKAAGE